jgi:hypothetical protein
MANPPVLLGNFKRNDIIRTFYQRCGEETLGPGRVPTGGIVDYTTLEDLLDILIAKDLPAFIVVSHGHPEHGLLMKFTKGSPHDATGLVIDVLADLADASQRGTLDEGGNRVTNVAAQMGIKPAAAMGLITKMIQLRAKKRMVHIRGCNLGANRDLLTSYKRAWGLAGITAPNCRNIYSGINTTKPPSGVTVDELGERRPKKPKTRRRLFTWPENSDVGSLVIDVRDIDGHTKLDSESFLKEPGKASFWGEKLLGTWRQAPGGANSQSFILQLLWDNNEDSWYTPLEDGFRDKLVAV